VVQFPIGEELFDLFFNARTGYRAQFRYGWENGAAENAHLVTVLRTEIEACRQVQFSCRRLSQSFDDVGAMTAALQDIVKSLDPTLSKVWVCDRLIRKGGGLQDLNVSRSEPDLVFNNKCEPWRSLCADESNAWLDLKGAFMGDAGLYQLKDPAVRAARIGRPRDSVNSDAGSMTPNERLERTAEKRGQPGKRNVTRRVIERAVPDP
jgi:hypothetical protein